MYSSSAFGVTTEGFRLRIRRPDGDNSVIIVKINTSAVFIRKYLHNKIRMYVIRPVRVTYKSTPSIVVHTFIAAYDTQFTRTVDPNNQLTTFVPHLYTYKANVNRWTDRAEIRSTTVFMTYFAKKIFLKI